MRDVLTGAAHDAHRYEQIIPHKLRRHPLNFRDIYIIFSIFKSERENESERHTDKKRESVRDSDREGDRKSETETERVRARKKNINRDKRTF